MRESWRRCQLTEQQQQPFSENGRIVGIFCLICKEEIPLSNEPHKCKCGKGYVLLDNVIYPFYEGEHGFKTHTPIPLGLRFPARLLTKKEMEAKGWKPDVEFGSYHYEYSVPREQRMCKCGRDLISWERHCSNCGRENSSYPKRLDTRWLICNICGGTEFDKDVVKLDIVIINYECRMCGNQFSTG